MTFPSYWGHVIIPTDFHSIIFQRGRAKNHQPGMVDTRNQRMLVIPEAALVSTADRNFGFLGKATDLVSWPVATHGFVSKCWVYSQ